jgi:hypothetical protein
MSWNSDSSIAEASAPDVELHDIVGPVGVVELSDKTVQKNSLL